MNEQLRFARRVVEASIRAGADDAEVFLTLDEYLWLRSRRRRLEKVERATVVGFGLKVLKGRRKAYVTGSDLTISTARWMIEKALSFARASSPDRHHSLPERPRRIPAIDLFDPRLRTVRLAKKVGLLDRMEDAAYGVDRRVKNTQEADYWDSSTLTVHVNSRGLAHVEERTSITISIAVVAQRSGEKQVGGQHQQVRFFEELDPIAVGREAGEAAARMLGAGPVPTMKAPVVFDSWTARRVLSGLVGAVNGELVLRGESFLRDRLGESVAAPHVTIRDRSRLGRGYGDMAVDGEGVLARDKALVDRGVLTTFLHNLYSASRARATPTGSVLRPTYESEGGLGPANLYLEPGTLTRQQVIATVPRGLFVTGLMGSGLNQVTGDWSVGASGLVIENGRLGRPVDRVTLAANLKELFLGIEEIGSDLRFWGAWGAPSLKVREMAIGGV